MATLSLPVAPPSALGDSFIHVSRLDCIIKQDSPMLEIAPPKIIYEGVAVTTGRLSRSCIRISARR